MHLSLYNSYSAAMTEHEEEMEVNLEDQRKLRTKQIKAVGRLLRDVQTMKERETAVTLSLIAVMDKSTELNTITRRANRSIELLFDHEEDEGKTAEDEQVRLEFNHQVNEVSKLCQDLGAFKKTSLLSQTIEKSLKAVEDLVAADATTDCSACLPDIQKQLDEMCLLLRDSTLKPTDELWSTHELLNARMMKAKSQKKTDKAPVTIIKAEYDRDFDIPKVVGKIVSCLSLLQFPLTSVSKIVAATRVTQCKFTLPQYHQYGLSRKQSYA